MRAPATCCVIAAPLPHTRFFVSSNPWADAQRALCLARHGRSCRADRGTTRAGRRGILRGRGGGGAEESARRAAVSAEAPSGIPRYLGRWVAHIDACAEAHSGVKHALWKCFVGHGVQPPETGTNTMRLFALAFFFVNNSKGTAVMPVGMEGTAAAAAVEAAAAAEAARAEKAARVAKFAAATRRRAAALAEERAALMLAAPARAQPFARQASRNGPTAAKEVHAA